MHVSKVTQSWGRNNHSNDVLVSTHWLTVPGVCTILLEHYRFHFQMRKLRPEAMNRPV